MSELSGEDAALQSVRVRVVDAAGLKAWRPWQQPNEPWFHPAEAAKKKCAETGETVVCIHEGGDRFSWVCPGCGGLTGGTFGPEPVSGWDAPRWTREGADDALTLMPSLGCPWWRSGKCIGHWWVRDGRMVLA